MQMAKCKWRILMTLLLLLLGTAGLICVQGCGGVRSDSPPPQTSEVSENFGSLKRLDGALATAEKYLIDHQDADGAWRSDVYGVFKDGPSLTPLVLATLLEMPPSAEAEAACQKGASYLAHLVRADGTIDEGPHGLTYPVYTAVFSVIALSRPQMAQFLPARDAWLRFLQQRQLTEELGWQPADKQYGGWGYSHQIPRKPQPGEPLLPLTESNLSASTLALEAMRAAGYSADDSAFRKALIFIQRCQNYSEDEELRDGVFDDGGFFFIYDDAVRNKAGTAGKDRNGRERFASYGSTTADGLRSLLACGLPRDHPRVQAARAWLEKNFHPPIHPGRYAKNREMNRQAVYFYYSASLAKAFHLTNPKFEIRNSKKGRSGVNWAEEMADDLLNRQQPDGSWINSAVAVREDDPIVATCLASQALVVCR
jgi:squalene-hopene/tetraprenyl-beta-curcumene cyclase